MDKPTIETLERGNGTRDWMIHQDSCRPLKQQGVVAAGYTELGIGYELVRVKPAYANVVVCCEGQLEFLIEGRWQPAQAGAVLIAPHGVPHGVRTLNARAVTAWAAFHSFPPPAGQRVWDAGVARIAGVKDYRPLWWALQGLYNESTGPLDASAVGHWADLLLTAISRLTDEQRQDLAAQLRPVWEKVDIDLSRPWTASAIAELANLSLSHFRRLCRERMGRSPARQLAHLRMQRAAMLLKTTERKLTSVAAAVGYENVFAFSVAFKRWSGRSPEKYRSR